MIDLEFLQSLIRALDESGLDSVELERGGTRVRLSKTPSPILASAPAQAAPGPIPEDVVREKPADASPAESGSEEGGEAPTSKLVEIVSPMVGTFYRAPAPDAPPYAEEGDRVTRGETVCIIEAMKLMNELESDVSGTIVEVCVEDADPVEYGQVLFRVEPS